MDLKTTQELEISTEVRRDWVFLACLVLLLIVLAYILATVFPGCSLAHAREGTASSLISQLSQAAKAYELDFAVFPPGTGKDSKDLAFYLQKKGAKQMTYFEFNSDMLDQGNVVNPVWGKESEPPKNWIHYRFPGLHNPKTFDLWCADSKGKVDGINNWER